MQKHIEKVESTSNTLIKVLPRRGSRGASELSYLLPQGEKAEVGQVVRIDVGGRKDLAITTDVSRISAEQQKALGYDLKNAAPTDFFVPRELIELQDRIASRSGPEINQVANLLVPRTIAKRPRTTSEKAKPQVKINSITLTDQQLEVVNDIESSRSTKHILKGITGSGKTQVYLRLAQNAAERSLSTIIMIPEIGLTEQISEIFESINASVFHLSSALTSAKKSRTLAEISALTRAGKPVIVIGPRSTLFSPLHNLGLIVIDEFHDQSYENLSVPHYNAVSAASKLIDIRGSAKLVLGSATPDVATYQHFKLAGLPIHKLNNKAVQSAKPAQIVVRSKSNPRSSIWWLTAASYRDLKESTNRDDQVLVFHNRRGSYPIVVCDNCGYSPKCTCGNHLTAHDKPLRMLCHVCGRTHTPPSSCPECKKGKMTYSGLGLQQIHRDLSRRFPGKRVLLAESGATTRSTSNQPEAEALRDADIIVGTQSIIQGRDFPRLKLIIVPSFEHLLNNPDPFAGERLFRSLNQLAGRIGRHSDGNKMIIEARDGQEYLIKKILSEDYDTFFTEELSRRKQMALPPYNYSLLIKCEYKKEQTAIDKLQTFSETLPPKITVKGPLMLARRTAGGKAVGQLLLLSKSMSPLIAAAENAPKGSKVHFDPRSLA